MEVLDVGVDGVRRSVCNDNHVPDEIDEIQGHHTTGGKGESGELRRDDNGDEVREQNRTQAIEEEDDEEIARCIPRAGCLLTC